MNGTMRVIRCDPDPDAINIGKIHRERQLEVFRKIKPAPTRKWWEVWK